MTNLFLALILISNLSCATRTPQASAEQTYDRKAWKHWMDYDHDCQNTRNEILQQRSLTEVTFNKKGCKVVSGRWVDYYFDEQLFEAKEVDIDHLVPLKNAHMSGGASWSRGEKEMFANDPENLVITNLKYNRKKGSKGIDQWLPVDSGYACVYVRDWIKIKNKYRLKILKDEQQTISSIAPTCKEHSILL